jgi:hypothetical protein
LLVGSVAAYPVSVAIGFVCGGWALWRLYRRYPALRNTPSTLRRSLAGAFIGGAILVLLGWVVGEWNGIYSAGGGTFAAVMVIGDFAWPRFQASREPDHAAA